MKEIKDYLHFYPGCEVMLGDVKYTLWYIKEERVYLKRVSSAGFNKWNGCSIDDAQLKPLFRHLSDMTEEECEFFYEQYFDRRYAEDWSGDNGSAYFKPKKVKPTFHYIKRIIEGDDYRSDNFMRIVELTKWLLDQHFDIFNLIPEGLAFDKTKT